MVGTVGACPATAEMSPEVEGNADPPCRMANIFSMRILSSSVMAVLIVVALLPVIFSGKSYWMNLASLGICYSIIFLNYTLIAGEGPAEAFRLLPASPATRQLPPASRP